ncbi:MAG: protocatechuate 3,4-dioxygenase subunit alpha [Bauldia sp.]
MKPNLLPQTPSQTVGPFFAFALAARQYGYDFPQIAGSAIATPDAPGEHIRVTGRVIDGEGVPIPDSLIEVWQADASGRYPGADAFDADGAFLGFGRYGTGTGPETRFTFDTVKPGGHDGEAPHLNLIVTMRGLLLHAFTRLYFSDEAAANERCAVLALVPQERRRTLVATREETPAGPLYRFDIHMQGPDETVFFDV